MYALGRLSIWVNINFNINWIPLFLFSFQNKFVLTSSKSITFAYLFSTDRSPWTLKSSLYGWAPCYVHNWFSILSSTLFAWRTIFSCVRKMFKSIQVFEKRRFLISLRTIRPKRDIFILIEKSHLFPDPWTSVLIELPLWRSRNGRASNLNTCCKPNLIG